MKDYIIKYIRKGKCEPEKCGNACCRNLNPNMSDKFNSVKGVCSHLKNGKCELGNKRYDICKEFPISPFSTIYQEVKDKCTYTFKEKKIEVK